MTGINEVAKEIHENAVAHGWWDEERGFPEVLALIHSEVSEALEEYRNGHGATEIYFSDSGKPEGIPTELADVIIRVLDYCGYAGINIDAARRQEVLIMAERESRLPYYIAGEFEGIAVLEATTSGLQSAEVSNMESTIEYLHRKQNGGGGSWWYKHIQRAGADSAAGKELFNMKENKHGFEPKQEFTMGGIAWTVIQTGADWVKCIASDCVEERAFDEGNKNDFAASSLRAYLNGEFLRRLIKAGAPEEMFEYFNIDLTADDGLKNYGGDRVRIGLITCEEYRLLRGNIPALPDRWWWTATPDSPINSFVRNVHSDGSLVSISAYYGGRGVRPLCNLKSEILVSYLNGENAEEQKKRAEAVDMMKHIAAAWDIDAEEVFGRADE